MASGWNIAGVAPLAIHEVRFEGGILQRGFWLYVWEVTPADQAPLYYVGRTGDSSSTNAQSPFNRMGQHLGFAKNSNEHAEMYGIRSSAENIIAALDAPQFKFFRNSLMMEKEKLSQHPVEYFQRLKKSAASTDDLCYRQYRLDHRKRDR